MDGDTVKKEGQGHPASQEVQNFNPKGLRKTTTKERKTLPTQAEIDEEKKACAT